MNGRPLSPIGGGLNESVAPSEQPQGTYRQGENVRGIDPRTGQVVWGAQRAGMRQLGDKFPEGVYARHFATASKLVNARQLAELAVAEDPTIEPPALRYAEWSVLRDEDVLDVAEGIDGQGYFLLASGDVAVVSKGGALVETILTAPERQFTPVPRVFVGEQGEVYTAGTRDEAFEGGAGRVYRWVKNLDDIWELAWTSVIEGPISTFAYGSGLLYVAEDPIEVDGDRPPPALTRVGSPLLGPELAWRQNLVPRPIFDLAITPRGQCLVSCPASELRSRSQAGFTVRAIDWTPPELPGWERKGWAWLDAFAVNDEADTLEDGDSVQVLRDRRFEVSDELPEPDPQSPRREMRSMSQSIFVPPTWDAAAFNGLGGIKFTSRSAMVSLYAEEDGPDSALAGSGSQAIIPTALDSFTMVMIVQLTEEQLVNMEVGSILRQSHPGVGQANWQFRFNQLADFVLFYDLASVGVSPANEDATRAVILSVEADGDGAPLRLYLNGLLVATSLTSPDSIKQVGPYTFNGGNVEVRGAYTVIGAGEPNRFSLLTEAGVTVGPLFSSGGFPIIERADRMHDGIGSTTSLNLHANLALTTQITFALPGDRTADSLAIWSAYGGGTPSTVKVELRSGAGTIPDPYVYTEVANAPLRRAPTETRQDFQGVPTRTELPFDEAANGVFNGVRLTFSQTLDGYVISEVELLEQRTEDAEVSADFVLGELVAFNGVAVAERQLVEGYMAHRWGVVNTLDATVPHPYRTPGLAPAGAGVGGQAGEDAAIVASNLASPLPILAKYGTDGTPLAAYTGGGVGFGAAASGDRVFGFGDPEPDGLEPADDRFGDRFTRFKDTARGLELTATLKSDDRPLYRPTSLAVGPCATIFVPYLPRTGGDGIRAIHRYDGDSMALEWEFNTLADSRAVRVGGLQFDGTSQGLGCGPEFLFAATKGNEGARRIDTLGLQATGEKARRDVERLAVLSNGNVMRLDGETWTRVGEEGALPGELPGSATLFGLTVFADGTGYRAYDHANRTLRNFEASVTGDMPPRCQLIAAYRSRLLVARGDNAFTIYQSAFGKPFDFDFGAEVNSIAQAAAGTIASQGRVPEPITALIPYRDDFLFIGTTESLFVLSGDLSDGGRLDQVDKSQGVAFGYAWCESPSGVYYFSARGGLMRLVPGGGLNVVSEGAIQRRLEDIDLQANRIRMAYNWIDKTVHIYVIAEGTKDLVQHFVYEERMRAWHVDSFGEEESGRVSTVASLVGDTADDRTLILGFEDGTARIWDQYAPDDAGQPIKSRVLTGPIVPGTASTEIRISGIEADLAIDQGPIEVAVRASNTADAPGPPSPFQILEPGRGFGVGVNYSAPAVFVEVRGTGVPWAAHVVRAELSRQGRARNIS